MDVSINCFPPPARAATCKLRLSRPVLPGRADSFRAGETAPDPFDGLLELAGVTAVAVEHDLVVLLKDDRALPWEPLVEQARELLTAYFASGRAPELPTIGPEDEAALQARVEEALATVVNPALAEHGGAARLVKMEGSRVFIELSGGCQGCGMSAITVRRGVRSSLQAAAPEVTEVIDVTDHAAGDAPYFQPSQAGESALPAAP
ncbi:MAG: NifU family protein [Acidobacteriota bacterium]